jgi:hypothetical protein
MNIGQSVSDAPNGTSCPRQETWPWLATSLSRKFKSGYCNRAIIIEAKRKVFIRKWQHNAVADSLEKAGDKLFTSRVFPPFASRRAIFSLRARPRGEERGLGWKLRQVA